ncbi:MAG: methylenetetrahydrofolate reductase [Kineosporiaceae bacterium]|nr:methylenetetrahydrofolate reductase [Kineosporiaceae bacterium]MBK7621500.1 methylenetetrahydrofolate reductase [Kineosporiaceae bacterium]MBK8077336.1 methylenetetrahydrofolate reductase [Kineosporiaceae bacterium]
MRRILPGGHHEAFGRLLRAARYEVLPTATIEAKVLDAVPKDVTLTVTASPVKGLDPTLDLAEKFAAHGYTVVPHIAVRLLRGEQHLAEVVERVTAAGITEVFMPAGDADPPAGDWDASLPGLQALSRLGDPIPEVGITGYPESHPAIDDDVTVQAMWDKRSHATNVVSNMCFDPKLISNWVKRVRRRGIELPIKIGVAGPVERTKLLTMATKVGVGESTRFLTKHAGWFARMAGPGYAPEALIGKVAHDVGGATYGVSGLHVFTFNQVAETEAWRQKLLADL